ncbi:MULTISPECIES: hypothetical protein [Streptomyces]|uniref:Uncharacterized protein n=1 Tax=Streptomyces griseiscabiei TaxID=2993540 RepID=A0ABU4LJS3_9ACTN|nr:MULTISPECIES: hypothetical protein [Streptomyces]MBZ3908549.1 hypothetical protein [Streptomyces griseiscabiei]MDX2916070.1 hypothetical protein [Streptomyces griseiscabiei]
MESAPTGQGAVARILPALPDTDPEAGEIRWDRWEPALLVTHIDPTCRTCAFPGPLSTAFGKTWYTPEPTQVRIQRSRPGEPSKWARVQGKPYWCKTHYAVRCPQCDEMTVYRRQGWVEIHYRPPTTERAVPSTDDNVLF